MQFDENDAIRYMRSNVEPSLSAKYSDDELFNLIDLIYDYYEANGLLDIDLADDDDELDLDDMMAYIARMLRKDKGAALQPDDALPLVKAYMAYEDTIDPLDDDDDE